MSNDFCKVRHYLLIAITASFVMTLVLAACVKPTNSLLALTIEHEITPQPARVGLATLRLKLFDAERRPVSGASIAIEGNMSHAGMSPVFAEAKETDPGHYQANLDLTMAGDWIILTRITLVGGQKLERQLDVRGVRAD
jgi:hypothetical protein